LEGLKNGVPIFGALLRYLLINKRLKAVIIKGSMKLGCQAESFTPIFKNYVDFLYKTRLANKKSNPVMAQCIKILLNSLYGKFG
jgi:hypothetical protein